MSNRQFQIQIIKIRNIIKKGEFPRAIQSLHQLIAQVLESGSDEMKAQIPAIETQISRLIGAC